MEQQRCSLLPMFWKRGKLLDWASLPYTPRGRFLIATSLNLQRHKVPRFYPCFQVPIEFACAIGLVEYTCLW